MKALAPALIALALAIPQAAHPFSWNDAINLVAPTVTVPFEAGRRVLRGEDPSPAVSAPLQSAGRGVIASVEIHERVMNIFMGVPRETIRNNLGEDWRRAYDTLLFAQRIQMELTNTSGRYLGRCLEGQSCDLLSIVAAPLAAALRDAYNVYAPLSRPLNIDTQIALRRVLDPRVLSTARWVVAAPPELNLPGFINAGNTIAGRGYAVTIGNVIVFNRDLSTNNWNDVEWLLHELRHVQQYMNFSNNVYEAIDGFSVEYVRNYNGLEEDADNAARAGIQILRPR